MKKILLFILSVSMFIRLFDIAVFSYSVPDLDRLGSISVTMRYGDESVSGGSMALYRVADVTSDNGNFFFTPCGDFASLDEDITDVDSDSLSLMVAAFIEQNDIIGITMPIDSDGRVTFYDLKPGLYMLIQTVAAKGYNCANPFLVTLPMNDGEYLYDVDASAKVELNDPDEETKPDSGNNTTTANDDDKLPQTGQLNWPIPILLVSGTALILIGMILCFGQGKANNEK